jgi:hypothetical protein
MNWDEEMFYNTIPKWIFKISRVQTEGTDHSHSSPIIIFQPHPQTSLFTTSFYFKVDDVADVKFNKWGKGMASKH